MNLINSTVAQNIPADVEFFWAEKQENLVVFKGEDVLAVIGLEPNTLAEATRRAENILRTLSAN